MSWPPPRARRAIGNSLRPSPRRFRLFLIGTEFFSASGGIQYVNRLLWHALQEFASHTPSEMQVFAYGDPANTPVPAGFADEHIVWHAAGRSRTAIAGQLARELSRATPHVVLFTHVSLLKLMPMVRWLAPRARCAVLGHGVEVWEPLPSRLHRELLRCASVVTPSEYTRRRLIEVNGVAPSVTAVLPHGLTPEWQEPSDRRIAADNRGLRFLTVTRLSSADAYKGVDITIRAMPRILERCPEAEFHIIGEGSDRLRLEKLAGDTGVRAQVQFRGELRGDDLRQAYESASIFVLPSTQEGFGIVFAEAMSHSLPVVGARAAAAPEVVLDGETGILVPPEAPEQLASAVSGLLLLPEERARMGAAGQKRVRENYLYRHFAARWHRWLASVASEPIYLAKHTAAFTNLETVEGSQQASCS
jgi:phosphatidylinositol alpha-1,6-mannosyltransferase